MSPDILSHALVFDTLAWLLTYLLHSTLLIGGVWLVSRCGLVRSASIEDVLWKVALLGGLCTASLQAGLGVQPFTGRIALLPAVTGQSVAPPRPSTQEFASSAAHEGGVSSRPSQALRADTPSAGIRPSTVEFALAVLPSNELFLERLPPAGASPGGTPATRRGEPGRSDVRDGLRRQDAPRSTVQPSPRLQLAGSRLMAEPQVRQQAVVEAPPLLSDNDASSAHVTRPWLLVAASLWLLLALVGLLRFAVLRRRLLGALGERRPVESVRLLALLGRLQHGAGLRRPVRLTTSPFLAGPIALGLSEICVPVRALDGLQPQQQEALLAHELAHLQRLDPLWLTACALLEALFFFQPLNRLARRRMQAVSEFLADDWAVARTGRRVTLAQCLAEVASWIEDTREVLPVAGMARPDSSLLERVRRLADGAVPRRTLRRRTALLLAATLLSVVACSVPAVSAGSDGESLHERLHAVMRSVWGAIAGMAQHVSTDVQVVEEVKDDGRDGPRAPRAAARAPLAARPATLPRTPAPPRPAHPQGPMGEVPAAAAAAVCPPATACPSATACPPATACPSAPACPPAAACAPAPHGPLSAPCEVSPADEPTPAAIRLALPRSAADRMRRAPGAPVGVLAVPAPLPQAQPLPGLPRVARMQVAARAVPRAGQPAAVAPRPARPDEQVYTLRVVDGHIVSVMTQDGATVSASEIALRADPVAGGGDAGVYGISLRDGVLHVIDAHGGTLLSVDLDDVALQSDEDELDVADGPHGHAGRLHRDGPSQEEVEQRQLQLEEFEQRRSTIEREYEQAVQQLEQAMHQLEQQWDRAETKATSAGDRRRAEIDREAAREQARWEQQRAQESEEFETTWRAQFDELQAEYEQGEQEFADDPGAFEAFVDGWEQRYDAWEQQYSEAWEQWEQALDEQLEGIEAQSDSMWEALEEELDAAREAFEWERESQLEEWESQLEEIENEYEVALADWESEWEVLVEACGGRDCDHDCETTCALGCTHPELSADDVDVWVVDGSWAEDDIEVEAEAPAPDEVESAADGEASRFGVH